MTRRPTGRRSTGVVVNRPPSTYIYDRPPSTYIYDRPAIDPWIPPWSTYSPPTIAAPAIPDETRAPSILDSVIPMVYGTRKVVGKIGAWEYDDANKLLSLGVIFGYGEQDSITLGATYLNGEAINSPAFITNEAIHVGDGSAGLSSVLTNMDAWDAGAFDDTALWKYYAHAAMILNCRTGRVPQGFVVEADLGGMLIDTRWRTGGADDTASTNLAEIGYHIATDANWKGLAAGRIHTASWEVFANWCDDTMSDTSARYEFNGILAERDPDKAMAMVLGHGLAKTFIGDDGKLHVWAEMAPPQITGEWSASASTTITEDSTAGEAESELEADDWVYVDTNLRQVDSVTDDDTVELKTAVTVSGKLVRPISNVYIKKHDWQQPPAAAEASILATPDEYRVRFADGANLGSHEVLSTFDGGGERIIEASLEGCTSAAVAARIAETTLKVAWLQAYSWAGPVSNETAAALEPGDVLLFDDDVLTQQAARVLPPIIANPNGTYMLQLREYDPAAYHEGTATTDTPPALGTGWDANDPPIVNRIETVYSGTTYDLVGMGSTGIYDGRVVLGDTGRNAVLGGSDIRLPYEIPLYGLKSGGATVEMIQMGAAGGAPDKLIIGDGSEAIYAACTAFVVQKDAPIQSGTAADWGSRINLIKYESITDSISVGDNVTLLDLVGDKIAFDTSGGTVYFVGHYSGAAAAPTDTELPADHDFCIWEDTDTNTWSWFVNDNTTIRQIS